MTEFKLLRDLTKEEMKEMGEAIEALHEEPMKGFKRFYRSILKPFRKKNRDEACYFVWKVIFNTAGMPFSRMDAQNVRSNMLRLSEKLYEVHKAQVDEIDQELERADE